MITFDDQAALDKYVRAVLEATIAAHRKASLKSLDETVRLHPGMTLCKAMMVADFAVFDGLFRILPLERVPLPEPDPQRSRV